MPSKRRTPAPAAVRPGWVARARKFLAAAAGLAAQVAASGVLDDAGDTAVRLWVQAGLAVLTAAGIYAVPNARP